MNTQTTYRYQLDRTSKKFKCPDCGHKTYVLYRDTETGEYVSEEFGRCDRENACGRIKSPKVNAEKRAKHYISNEPIEQPVAPDYVPEDMFLRSFEGFMLTNFALFVTALFGPTIAKAVLLKYAVGRSRLDGGKACIFFRIDSNEKVRTGKAMAYILETGRRNKDITPTWVHSVLKPFNMVQCFFGEHLIKTNLTKPIGIVESEKTAIIASVFMPQLIWIATGGKTGVKLREYGTYKVLQGRRVIMFPDFGNPDKSGKTPYDKWCEIAEHIRERIKCDISVSRLLEDKLPAEWRSEDLDLVDLLVKRDPDIGCAVNDEGLPMILQIDEKKLGIDFLDSVKEYKS